jgi:hypothetical protein
MHRYQSSLEMRVLNHTPWGGAFPLSHFNKKIHEFEVVDERQNVLKNLYFQYSLGTVSTTYQWLVNIIERIDENFFNVIPHSKILARVSQGDRIHYDELPPIKVPVINLDVYSLIIFLDILLDDTSRFLEYLFIEPHFLKFGCFKDLKYSMNKCGGERIEELNKIIQSTDWYLELNKLRNQPVVHIAARQNMIERRGDNVGIYLRTRTSKYKISEIKFMSNLVIDELCDNVHSFLKELNNFLCNNFDYLPMESRKK